MTKPPILFVHGMFMTGASWQGWVDTFEARGHACHAPSWPGRERPPAELRERPDAVLERLTLDDVVDHFAARIEELPEAPMLIGHSMGGLVVQLLLGRGLGRAGVALDSAPPKGVLSFEWSFLKSNAATLVPTKKPIVPTVRWFHTCFANTLDAATAADAYERWCVPESRLVGRGPTTAAAKIDFTAPHAPLLLTAGERDRIIPASLSATNHARYAKSEGRTELKTFAGRSHFLIREPGWEEVASYCAEWLDARA